MALKADRAIFSRKKTNERTDVMRSGADKLRKDLKYLTLLAREYPSIASACSEIINLQAILKLPKGTEHFMSDLHGEAEAFTHIMNNASGVIKEKVDRVLGEEVSAEERAEFATLIYYPSRKLDELKARQTDLPAWYRQTASWRWAGRTISSRRCASSSRRWRCSSCTSWAIFTTGAPGRTSSWSS